MKKSKPLNKKKIMAIMGTATVIILLLAVTLYAFLGRGDNTRTHFNTVKGDVITTDYVVGDNDDNIFNDNEFVEFEYDVVDYKDMEYGETFKQRFPQITSILNDKNFCASQTDVKSLTFNEGLLVVDSYSYTEDYSIRYLDMLYVPYSIENDRSITLSKPRRLTVKYDTTLALVSYCELDIANFRVSPYNINLNVKISNKAEKWDVATAVFLRESNGEIAKKVSQNVSILNSAGETISTTAVGTNKVDYTTTLEGLYDFKVRLNFDDTMFSEFEKLTVSMINERKYHCDSAMFHLTVNE